jgi:hypothetical protein
MEKFKKSDLYNQNTNTNFVDQHFISHKIKVSANIKLTADYNKWTGVLRVVVEPYYAAFKIKDREKRNETLNQLKSNFLPLSFDIKHFEGDKYAVRVFYDYMFSTTLEGFEDMNIERTDFNEASNRYTIYKNDDYFEFENEEGLFQFLREFKIIN